MKSSLVAIFMFFNILIGSSQEKNVFDIARKGTIEDISELFEKLPDSIDVVDDRKSSPLILAAYHGNTDVALFLANKVKNVNYNSEMGTALMAAVMSSDLKICQKLIEVKADLDQTDSYGKTALIYTTFFNKNDIAKLLINSGATKKIKDKDDRTALDYANFNKNTELIILLNN